MIQDQIGTRIKRLRKENGMTLKQISDLTDLSVGFLSQLERGITSVAIDTLYKIASVLGVNINYFFTEIQSKNEDPVMRRHESQIILSDKNNFIQYGLSKKINDKDMFPRLIEILPQKKQEKMDLYSHEGEEFIYILEGILTYDHKDRTYNLYPGDSLHIHSKDMHNWRNNTNGIVRLLEITTPNKFKTSEKQH